MKQLSIKPEIYEFPTFRLFAKEANLSFDDLIITNEYLFEPFMKPLNLSCQILYQEKYGTGEPTDEMVQQIIEAVKRVPCKRIIAVGGGTIIDIAKLLVLGGADDIYEMYDKVDSLKKDKELIIVPTTCGTGSEVTNLAIVNLQKIGVKKGLGSNFMYADQAVLIPEFMSSLPYGVFATSSIDALIHAIEAFLNPNATDYTDLFAKEAIRLILSGYQKIAKGGQDQRFACAEEFLRASNYAGIAFGNSGCATVHAMSYSFGGKYHVAHGESNYQFLIVVLTHYKKEQPSGKIGELELLIRNIIGDTDAIKALGQLLEEVLHLKPMSMYGATEQDIHEFAKLTYDNQQRLLAGSYVKLTEKNLEMLFEQRL